MSTQVEAKNVDIILDDITSSLVGKDKLILHNASYETGLLGFSLYFAYMAKYRNDNKYISRAEEYFDRGIAALDIHNFKKTYASDSIDTHLAHIGRFVSFTREHHLLDIDADDYLLKLDDILFELMKSKVSIKDFDVLSGALAAGYYFLSRKKDGVDVDEQLRYLVHSLENFSEKDKDGDYYWKSPSLYDRIYIGISHGSCLMISFLSSVYDYGVEQESCRRIIGKAVNFVLKQYRKSKYKGLFPNMIGDPVEPMQFALCYGDIGNGYALYKASKILTEERIKTFSGLVLDDCLTRSKKDNLTLDAGIFYGASGLVIAFDKLARLTGNQRFNARTKYWYEQIPKYQIYDTDFAGFQTRLVDKEEWLWNVSFGWGILGIGVTLMAYSDKNLPPVDQLSFVA